MDMPLSEQRQIENEMIFRRRNETIGDNLDALDAALIEDGHVELIRTTDLSLHVLCECSDENCTTRIPIKLSKYRAIHENRRTFIVSPSHQVEAIESVIERTDSYSVVKKNHSTAEPGAGLNTTTINNS